MQLALLIGASPKTSKKGPIVRLPAGRWMVRAYGLNSSTLQFNGPDDPIELSRNTEIELPKAADIFVDFKIRGVEDYVTVIAESHDGL